MKRLVFAGAVFLVASGASADPSYTITTMTCARVQAAVRASGSAVLHYRSPRNPNMPLYGRYISDSRFCDSRNTVTFASVPTADKKSCPVKKCAPIY
jgi:hypothetical protein